VLLLFFTTLANLTPFNKNIIQSSYRGLQRKLIFELFILSKMNNVLNFNRNNLPSNNMKKHFQVSTLICVLVFFSSSTLFSQQRSINQVGAHSYVAGPTSQEIDLQAAEKECLNWSWAACLQAVFKFYGLEVKQENIVKRIFKGLPCNSPNSFQIMNGLNGWSPDTGRKFSSVYAQAGVWTNEKITDALANRNPLLITLQNAQGVKQVYVLISIYYTEDGGMKVPEKVVVIEPAANADPFIVIPWEKYEAGKPEVFKFWITKKALPVKK
jgi:hypothetical protein